MARMGQEFGIGDLTMQRAGLLTTARPGLAGDQAGHDARVSLQLPVTNPKEQLLEQAQRVLAEVTKFAQSIEVMPEVRARDRMIQRVITRLPAALHAGQVLKSVVVSLLLRMGVLNNVRWAVQN